MMANQERAAPVVIDTIRDQSHAPLEVCRLAKHIIIRTTMLTPCTKTRESRPAIGVSAPVFIPSKASMRSRRRVGGRTADCGALRKNVGGYRMMAMTCNDKSPTKIRRSRDTLYLLLIDW
jgi:hypothetical protein